MIPSIFDAKVQSIDDLGQAEKADWSHRMSGALISIAGPSARSAASASTSSCGASYLSPAKSATTAFWVPGLLRGVRRDHLVRVPADAQQGARSGRR